MNFPVKFSPDEGGSSEATADFASSAATSDAGQTATPDAAQATDDRFSDPDLQKHISDRISSALRHIPNEYRGQDSFNGLMRNAKQFEALKDDQNYQAYLAARNGGQASQKPVAELLMESLGNKFGKFAEPQSQIMGAIADFLVKHMTDSVLPQYVEQRVGPMYKAYYGDKVNQEYAEAAKLPKFKDNEQAIRNKIAEYDGRITWHDAYKLAMHDAREAEEARIATGVEAEKTGAVSEKPTGAGSKDVSQKKPTSKAESRNQARAKLRSIGIDV